MEIFERDEKTRTTYLPPGNLYASQEATILELHMKQKTCSSLGKEYVKVVYHHLAYLTYMQSMSYEMPDWMRHKLESRL